jgi:antitoxin (DNA-binding transcriptional repressor) of toxin-antitoxin stability system
MTQVSMAEAQLCLPDLVLAAVQGEEVVIAQNDQAAVRLVPVAAERPRPRFGSARGQIFMADDFDAPLDDFREYMP